MSFQTGLWNFDGKPVERNLLTKLADAAPTVAFDGSQCVHIDGCTGMLYCAYNSTPESKLEIQPHLSSRGLAITWDGRLDNRDDLVSELDENANRPLTDAQVAASAFEKWGCDCFRRFIGDWALCVWDSTRRTLHLARDYMGLRSLYYRMTDDRIVWSTNLSSILLTSHDPFELDAEYVADYLVMYPQPDRTPYRQIRAVPPGHYVIFQNKNAASHRYWSLSEQPKVLYRHDSEYEDHFRHVFRQAVRRRLRSDAPILAELSGGIDSSSIVCMADDIISHDAAHAPRLDTLSFYSIEEPTGDERQYVALIERKRGRTGHHFEVKKQDRSLQLKPETLHAVPGVLESTDGLQTQIRDLMQKEGHRVVLSGIGGDEFMGGIPNPHPQIADLVMQFRVRELIVQLRSWSLAKKQPWLHLLLQSLIEFLPPSLRHKFERLGSIAPWIDPRFAHEYRLGLRKFLPAERLTFRPPSRREFARTVAGVAAQMNYIQLPVLGHADRRYPYLDRTLVEFLSAVPSSQILRPGERRSLMRRSLEHLVPHEILWRRTKAVSARVPLLVMSEQMSQLERLFVGSESANEEIIDDSRFRESLLAAKNGNAPQLLRMLRVIWLEVWLRDVKRRGLLKRSEMKYERPSSSGISASPNLLIANNSKRTASAGRVANSFKRGGETL